MGWSKLDIIWWFRKNWYIFQPLKLLPSLVNYFLMNHELFSITQGRLFLRDFKRLPTAYFGPSFTYFSVKKRIAIFLIIYYKMIASSELWRTDVPLSTLSAKYWRISKNYLRIYMNVEFKQYFSYILISASAVFFKTINNL